MVTTTTIIMITKHLSHITHRCKPSIPVPY